MPILKDEDSGAFIHMPDAPVLQPNVVVDPESGARIHGLLDIGSPQAPQPEAPQAPQPRAFGSLIRGFNDLQEQITIAKRDVGMIDDTTAAARIARDEADKLQAPPSQAVKEGLQDIGNAKGWGDSLVAFLRNPSATASIIGQSLPQSLGSMAGATIGTVGGRAGQAAGAGAGSFMSEYGSSVLQAMEDSGVNLKDAEAVQKAFADEKLMSKARDTAIKRGIPVGAFDALTMGLAGSILRTSRRLLGAGAKGTATGLGGELGMQMAGGMAGETGAQLNVSGKITSPSDIVAEGVGELIPGLGEIGIAHLRGGHTPTNVTPESELPQAAPAEPPLALPPPQRLLPAPAPNSGFQVDAQGNVAQAPNPTVIAPSADPNAPAINPQALAPTPTPGFASAQQPTSVIPGTGTNRVIDVPDIDPEFQKIAERPIRADLPPEQKQAAERAQTTAARANSGLSQSNTSMPQVARLYAPNASGTEFELSPNINRRAFFPTARQAGENSREFYVSMPNPLVVRTDQDLANMMPSGDTSVPALQRAIQVLTKTTGGPYSHVVLMPDGPGSSGIATITKGQDVILPTGSARGDLKPVPASKALPETQAARAFHALQQQLFPDPGELPGMLPLDPKNPPLAANFQVYMSTATLLKSQLKSRIDNRGYVYYADGKFEPHYKEGAKVHVVLDPKSFNPTAFQTKEEKAEWIGRVVENLKQRFGNPNSTYIVRVEPMDSIYRRGSVGFDVDTQTTEIHLNSLAADGPNALLAHSTLAHEFGHSLVWETFRHMSLAVRRGVMREYANWLAAVRNMTVKDFQLSYWDGAKYGRNDLLGLDTKIKDLNPDDLAWFSSYLLNFHEWSAQMFARAIERNGYDAKAMPSLTKFFAEFIAKLKELYRAFAKLGPLAEGWEKSFNDYLKLASVRWQLGAPSPASVGMQSFDQTADSAEVNWRLMDQVRESEMDTEGRDTLNSSLDRFGRFIAWSHTLLQWGELNPHIQGLQRYILAVQKFWSDKIAITADANDTIEAWNRLGKDQETRLAKFLFDLTTKSDELGRKLTPEEKRALAKQHGLKPEAFSQYLRIDGDMQTMLQKMEAAAVKDIATIFGSPTEPNAATMIRNIKADFKKMQGLDYFPLNRFGQYGVLIRAKGRTRYNGKIYEPGDVLSFETYESKREQHKRAEELRRRSKTTTIAETYLEDNAFAFQGFPPSMADYLKEQLNMTDDQREQFKKILANMSPGLSFKKHLLRRRGVAGFSQDAKRAYASYMMHGGNHIARIMNYQELTGAQAQVKADTQAINMQGGNSVARSMLHEAMLKHYRDLMNPGRDMPMLRAATFLWYLGFNVKSAFVNMVQLPTVAHPYFASRYGDAKATAGLVSAMRDVVRSVTSRQNPLSAEELNLMEKARESGFIDESFASDLAGASESPNLKRMLASTDAGRKLLRLPEYGAFLFHSVEQFMRRSVFLTAVRLARADGLNLEQQFDAGRTAVQKTMFEYARWNKPAMMRGKKAIFFVFMQYLQHALFFAAHDQGRARFLLLMLVLGGLQGLPGAEDMLDGMDWGATWLKNALGMESPRTDLRFEARKFINSAGLDPDLILHGLSRKSFGLSYLGMPELDVSGSLSLGRVVPGFGPLIAGLQGQDLNTAAARTATSAAGATVGVGMQLLQALASNNPDQWKRWENALPTALKNASRATRQAIRGAETNNLGDKLIEFDPTDTKQMTELIAESLGFNSTRLNQKRELSFLQQNIGKYYMTRREVLTAQYFYARKSGDREAIADVMDAIKRYNSQVPKPELRLSSLDVARSFRQRLRNQVRREAGHPPVRRLDSLYQELGAEYQ